MGIQWKSAKDIAQEQKQAEAVQTLGIPVGAKVIADGKLVGEVVGSPAPKKPAAKKAGAAKAASVQEAPKVVPGALSKAVAKAVPKAVVSEEGKLADELVALDSFMVEHDVGTKLKRIDSIKKQLQSVAADMDPTAPATFTGMTGEVTFSPAKIATTITDKNGVMLALGQDVFNQIANVTLTDAKKYLSEIELAKFTTQEYGSRTLQTCKKK